MFHLLMILCLGWLVGEGKSDLFRYEKFYSSQSEPPVYVEQMETIKIYAKTWKIVTRIDMSFMYNVYQHVQNIVRNMSTLCALLNNVNSNSLYALSSACTDPVKRLDNIVKEMDNTWKEIMVATIQTQEGYNHFNGRTFLNMFDKIIKKASPIENDTMFIDGSPELFGNNHTDELKIQTEAINRKISNINEVSNKYISSKELKVSIIKQLLQDLISYVTITIFDYKVNRKYIYDALSSGKVLSSTSLFNALKKIGEVVFTKKLELPFNIYDELTRKFYQSVTTQSTLVNQQFLFVYTVPIVEPVQFISYQLQPYPRKIEASLFQLILPEIQRVAVNTHLKQYFYMDDITLDKCYENGNYTLLCEFNQPIMSTEESSSCTVELLTKPELSNNCNLRIMNFNHEIWFKLQKLNSWLFVFPTAEEVSVDCNGDVDNRFVNGAGTLTIHPACLIKTKHVEILGSANDVPMRKNVDVSAEMIFNWKEIVDAVKKMRKNVTRYLVPRIINNDLQLLEKISTSVNVIVNDKIKTEEAETVKSNTGIVNSNLEPYIIYGIISFVMSCLAVIISHLIKKWCGNKKSTTWRAKYVRDRSESLVACEN